MNILRLLSMCAFSAALTACSGEPTQEEIDQAVREEIAGANQQIGRTLADAGGDTVGKLLGNVIKPEITVISVKKINCEKAKEKSGYDCEVETETKTPIFGKNVKKEIIYFVRTDDGLSAVRN